MKQETNPCEGCTHWRGCYYGDLSCNYIFDMGHRRPCPPGAACTVREEDPTGRKAMEYRRRCTEDPFFFPKKPRKQKKQAGA